MDGLLMKYFVLKPAGDDMHARASRAAMRTYALALKQDDAENDKFADEILDWVSCEFESYLERSATENPPVA